MTRAFDAGADDWPKFEALWEVVRDLPPDERDSFLASQAIDGALREELESLLAHANSAEAFFERLSAVVPRPGESMPTESGGSDGAATTGGPERPTQAETDPLIGTTVGHYEIVDRIGQGGMGMVYRATDLRLRRTVALKLLRARHGEDLRAKERLLVEARAAAALDHPNICTIYEVGETPDGSAFIAMAFYPGETLEQLVRRGPLPVSTALDYATQIARGLGAAHARGIIHRDVKPANVIITDDGVVKLLDFGIARTPDVEVSRDGVTPGTIAYMSPEQVTSRRLDQRTDLWSLGIVLYEMCTGTRPFGGESAGAVLYAIIENLPVPPSSVRPGLPASVDAVIARLLANDPEQRYRDAMDLVSALTATSVDGPLPTATPRGSDASESIAHPSARDGRGEPVLSLPASDGSPRAWGRRVAWVVAALSVGAGIVSWTLALRRSESHEGAPTTQAPPAGGVVPRIAVLPVRTVAADSLDALAEAMTEELISVLGREPDKLRAISSGSVARFRARRIDPRAIAETLGVSNVLEGHVQRKGADVRARVTLIDARDGTIRWTGTYDKAYRDIADAIEDVARAVADTLHVRLTRAAGTGLLSDGAQSGIASERRVAARDLFLRGRNGDFRTDSGRREVRRVYTLALETDSTFALGHAGMALCLAGPCPDDGEPRKKRLARAEWHALKAMALDSLSAESHGALGRVLMSRYEFDAAEARLKHSLEIDPTRSSFRDFLIWLYIFTDRPREALAEAERRLRDDPLSPNAIAELARGYLVNGRCDEAMAQLDILKRIAVPPARAAWLTAQCLGRRGLWQEAIDALQPTLQRNRTEAAPRHAFLLARAGRTTEAYRIRDSLQARWRRGVEPAYSLAVIHVGLRDFDEAFAWLDSAIVDQSLPFDVMEPVFEELHRDPRFDRIRAKLGIQKR